MYYSSMDEGNNHSKVTDDASSLTFTIYVNMNIKAVIILIVVLTKIGYTFGYLHRLHVAASLLNDYYHYLTFLETSLME
jgi:hypothetical protein